MDHNKKMLKHFENKRILLLTCPIVVIKHPEFASSQ